MAPPIECRFELLDHSGQAVNQDSYPGKHLLVYFGFTHCRVVCPRSLDKLSAVLDRLGARADAITPLYVSVDPQRDTPEVMKAYLETSYPRFTGLTGTPEQVEAARDAFKVFAQRKADPEDPDGYAVPHTAIAYLIDPQGTYLAHFPDHVNEDEVFDRIRTLLPA